MASTQTAPSSHICHQEMLQAWRNPWLAKGPGADYCQPALIYLGCKSALVKDYCPQYPLMFCNGASAISFILKTAEGAQASLWIKPWSLAPEKPVPWLGLTWADSTRHLLFLKRMRCAHICLDDDHTRITEARKAISWPAAETAFTPLVLGLSVRDKAWPGGSLTLPDEQSGHNSGELNEASGLSAVFHDGCSVFLCWLKFYFWTGYLSNTGGRELKILPVWLPAEGPKMHRHSWRHGDLEGLGFAYCFVTSTP